MEYEDDISAKEKTEKQSAWLQGQNEHTGRKESFSGKTCQRKKEIIRVKLRQCDRSQKCGLFVLLYVKWLTFMKHFESLKKNYEFQSVYRNGKSYANKYLVMYVKENGAEKNRIGISVSKKVGNSVVRHRITRLVRESYRLHEAMFNSGLDIVIVARKSAATAGYDEIRSGLLHLGKLHHVVVPQ